MRPRTALAAGAAAAACAAAAATLWYRRRRRRWSLWRATAARYPRELLCDPRITRALAPYPSAATAAALSGATGLPALKVRKFSAGARDGRCARPWHAAPAGGDAPRPVGRKCKASHYYFLLHKPVGLVTQRDDASTSPYATHAMLRSPFRFLSRFRRTYLPTVFDALPPGYPHCSPVGRLDKATSGLLLFTDDGALSTRLLRPSAAKAVTKAYIVDVTPPPDAAALASLRAPLEDTTLRSRETVFTAPAVVRALTPTRIRVTIAEGRHHQVRRLCARAGLAVDALHRERLGPLDLAGVAVGDARPLTDAEVAACLSLVGLAAKRGPPRPIPVPAAAPDLRRGDLEAALADLAARRAPDG